MSLTQRHGAVCLLALVAAVSVHQATSAADPAVERWRPLVEQAAARHGVPADLVLAIVSIESGGDPNARGAAGEIGLMQILPSTGQLLGVSAHALRDPATNIDTGARYLALELRATGGDVPAAVQGYNGGPRARSNPLPSTVAYTRAVLARRGTVAASALPRGEPVVATVGAARSRWSVDVVPQ